MTARWTAAVAFVGGVVGWGLYSYFVELSHGMISTGLRQIGGGGATWGLYLVFVVYVIGVSFAGVSTAALVRLFGIRSIEPLTRIAELLTIVAVTAGALSVLTELGRPLAGLKFLPQFARPASPFFGTFTLVETGSLFASLVYFYLGSRADAARGARSSTRLAWLYHVWAAGYRGTPAERARHQRVSFWLSLFILPFLVIAHSTLGFVFGIQGGRPGWFSALQAPGFVVLAGASGTGVLIMLAAAARRFLGLEETIRLEAFRLLGNFLWILTLTYLYFMVVEEITATYAASRADMHVAHEIVWGTYAPLFWTAVICFAAATAILFLGFVTRRTSVAWTVVAALLVNVGAILKRFLIVVPSQTHGMLLPYPEGRYVPSAGEMSVALGLFAFPVLLYLLFAKVFPIVPLGETSAESVPPEAPAQPEPAALRIAAFWATLLTGLTLAMTGLLLSFRVGTVYYADPVVPFSPLIFIVGVMMSFFSAAVYETIPPPRGR